MLLKSKSCVTKRSFRYTVSIFLQADFDQLFCIFCLLTPAQSFCRDRAIISMQYQHFTKGTFLAFLLQLHTNTLYCPFDKYHPYSSASSTRNRMSYRIVLEAVKLGEVGNARCRPRKLRRGSENLPTILFVFLTFWRYDIQSGLLRIHPKFLVDSEVRSWSSTSSARVRVL